MVESRVTVIEVESSRASAQEDVKKPDPDEKAAAEIIERNTIKKGGATHETTKKSD